MSKKVKGKVQVYVEYFFFRIATDFIRILPLGAAYACAKGIAWLIYTFDFKHSRRAVRHVLHSGIRTNRKDAKALAFASFVHMVKVFVEIVKFDQIVTDENFHKYFGVADDPISKEMMDPKTTFQIILTTAHLGNWELAGGAHSRKTGIPMTSIMRPLSNWKIGEYFYKRRCRYKHDTVSRDRGLRPLLLAHKQGHNITIVADQHASTHEGVEVTFFGHPVRAHATPALLALKTGTPIAMPFLVRKGDGFNFEFVCPPVIRYTPTGDKEKDVKTLVQMYTNTIENEVRRYPEQWLWAHRRWLDCGRGPWPRPEEKTPDKEKGAAQNDKAKA